MFTKDSSKVQGNSSSLRRLVHQPIYVNSIYHSQILYIEIILLHMYVACITKGQSCNICQKINQPKPDPKVIEKRNFSFSSTFFPALCGVQGQFL
jgi:hypothetical protein